MQKFDKIILLGLIHTHLPFLDARPPGSCIMKRKPYLGTEGWGKRRQFLGSAMKKTASVNKAYYS